MRRREFFGLIGGAAAWPLAARAQPQAARRIGVISAVPESDPEEKPRRIAFQQGLEQLGWATGRNLHIDFRWNNRGDVTRRWSRWNLKSSWCRAIQGSRQYARSLPRYRSCL